MHNNYSNNNNHHNRYDAPSPAPSIQRAPQQQQQQHHYHHQAQAYVQPSSASFIPSKVFQYIDRKFSNSSSESNLLPFKQNNNYEDMTNNFTRGISFFSPIYTK